MGHREQGTQTLFEAMDGPFLVKLGNWLADSLDVSELENEQVLLLQMVLERCLNALWRAFPEVIAPLILRRMANLESEEDR